MFLGNFSFQPWNVEDPGSGRAAHMSLLHDSVENRTLQGRHRESEESQDSVEDSVREREGNGRERKNGKGFAKQNTQDTGE